MPKYDPSPSRSAPTSGSQQRPPFSPPDPLLRPPARRGPNQVTAARLPTAPPPRVGPRPRRCRRVRGRADARGPPPSPPPRRLVPPAGPRRRAAARRSGPRPRARGPGARTRRHHDARGGAASALRSSAAWSARSSPAGHRRRALGPGREHSRRTPVSAQQQRPSAPFPARGSTCALLNKVSPQWSRSTPAPARATPPGRGSC